MSLAPSPGYSADVAIRLELGGNTFPVAQVGESSLIMATDSAIPTSTEAKLIVTVDDEEFPYDIRIDAVNGRQVLFT